MVHKLLGCVLAGLMLYGPGFVVPKVAEQSSKKDPVAAQAIKVKTELVEVRAVVTDRQGRPIENLTKEDFVLLENSRPREIDFFSVTSVEGGESPTPAAGATAPARVAVPKSVRTRLLEPPARTVVLYVDTLHLSVASLYQAKQALRRFVDEKLTEQDMVELVTSTGSLGIAEQFTRDKALLRYAIEKIGLGPTSHASFFTPYLAACIERGDSEAMTLGIALLRLEDGISGDRRMMEMMARGRASQVLSEASYLRKATLFTLKALAEQMTALSGQRMIAIFSDGFTMHESGGSVQTDELQTVISRAVRSGVAIYALHAKGLAPPPLFNASMRGGAAGPSLDGYLSASEKDELDGMNALAADTGGELFHNTNDLGSSLAKALDANRSYYVLGFYLGSEVTGRQFRRLSVRVKNHSEYNVRSPKGYYTPDAVRVRADETEKTPQQRLALATHEPLPLTVLAVSASADYMESDDDDAQVTVTVRIEGDNLEYRGDDQHQRFEVEVLSQIYDSKGNRVHGFVDLVNGTLTPDRFVLAKANGFRMTRRLAIKPGIYQARIGVRETATDRMGTATAWVEVPNLVRSKLALSNLILLDARGAGSNSTAAEGLSSAVSKSRVVQGVRLYPRDAACAYLFRIQQGLMNLANTSLVFQTEVLQKGKSVTPGDWRPVPADQKDGKGLTIGGQISLAGFESGIYELRITVKDPQSKQLYQRTAVFGIE
jgi:VWFA-related protein